MVLLNKTDIEGWMNENEVQQKLELDGIATHKWIILPCSAMTGENLENGLAWVVQDARDKLFLY